MKITNTLLLIEIAAALGMVLGWLLFGQREDETLNPPLTAQAEALMTWDDDGGAGGG